MSEELEYTDVMIDLETTGTCPDRTAILQLSAVRFNLEKRTVDPDFFDRCLTMPAHRHWQVDTLEWWGKQKKSTLEEIYQRQENHQIVIQDFVAWATQAEKSLRFWSKPSHFDYMFVQSYIRDAELFMPFHYRETTDMRSYIRGLFPDREYPQEIEDSVPFSGDAHNALMDTLHQIKVLFKFRDVKDGKAEYEFTAN